MLFYRTSKQFNKTSKQEQQSQYHAIYYNYYTARGSVESIQNEGADKTKEKNSQEFTKLIHAIMICI